MDEHDEPLLREPPAAGTEAETLVGALERQRRIFAWKCADLDADGMLATAAASTMTLGGLVKHMALVEDDLLSQRLLRLPPVPPGDPAHPDEGWHTTEADTPEQLVARWREAVARARANLRDALADDGLDRLTTWTNRSGEPASIRCVLIHAIEEYARHVGHADLIRESVDGRVGEQPPD
jgi:uncharacterized damage-inducible protein DinB